MLRRIRLSSRSRTSYIYYLRDARLVVPVSIRYSMFVGKNPNRRKNRIGGEYLPLAREAQRAKNTRTKYHLMVSLLDAACASNESGSGFFASSSKSSSPPCFMGEKAPPRTDVDGDLKLPVAGGKDRSSFCSTPALVNEERRSFSSTINANSGCLALSRPSERAVTSFVIQRVSTETRPRTQNSQD